MRRRHIIAAVLVVTGLGGVAVPALAGPPAHVAGSPADGSVGRADGKQPPGQTGDDANHGYRCDGNPGIGGGNPAHSSGCIAAHDVDAPPVAVGPSDTVEPPALSPSADGAAADAGASDGGAWAVPQVSEVAVVLEAGVSDAGPAAAQHAASAAPQPGPSTAGPSARHRPTGVLGVGVGAGPPGRLPATGAAEWSLALVAVALVLLGDNLRRLAPHLGRR